MVLPFWLALCFGFLRTSAGLLIGGLSGSPEQGTKATVPS